MKVRNFQTKKKTLKTLRICYDEFLQRYIVKEKHSKFIFAK